VVERTEHKLATTIDAVDRASGAKPRKLNMRARIIEELATWTTGVNASGGRVWRQSPPFRQPWTVSATDDLRSLEQVVEQPIRGVLRLNELAGFCHRQVRLQVEIEIVALDGKPAIRMFGSSPVVLNEMSRATPLSRRKTESL
jgi:hypothetical protein